MIEIEYRGYYIRVGKSQTENNKLVCSSYSNDYWVHADGYPSGHAIISNQHNKRMPIKILKRACCLIKSNSPTLKYVDSLSFHYTRRINVNLTDVPGKVVLTSYSTISI